VCDRKLKRAGTARSVGVSGWLLFASRGLACDGQYELTVGSTAFGACIDLFGQRTRSLSTILPINRGSTVNCRSARDWSGLP